MTRVRVKVVTGDTFLWTSMVDTEEEAYSFLSSELRAGNIIPFESGRFALAVAHIVSIEVSSLTSSD